MGVLTNFERYILAQAVPSLDLPEICNGSDVDLFERGWILGYGHWVARSEDNLRRLAMVVGILPASAEEVRELEMQRF
jgi:hypothetical protein